jgi:hypothetical protein
MARPSLHRLENVPMLFSTEMEKLILKFIWKYKKALKSKGNPEEIGQWWKYHNTRLQIRAL